MGRCEPLETTLSLFIRFKKKICDNLNKLANKKKINRNIYTEFRNQLTKELRQAKTKYFAYQFEMNANDTKKNLGNYK